MTAFSAVSAVTPTAEGAFNADIHPAWTIDGKPNGGYLLAIIARAATAASSQPHVIAASAHYLRAPRLATVSLHVEVLRTGRTATQLRARLVQDGECCVEALFTMASLDATVEPRWAGGVPPAPTGRREDAVRIPSTSPTGLPVAIMDEVDLRLDPETTGFAVGRPSGSGLLTGWLALPGDEQFDAVSLLYAVDAFPPATFEIEASGWVPTLELTAYVRALPARGPVRIIHRAGLIDAGRVDEQCWVFDSRGRLVAQSTQLAGIRI
ncbi:thioesterase family protein [uncultured Jatrophihabitans sp.]|uniref:thioesterase family protein n=1 Tax=uncultured Jatrophihabitans sp. TaxID=1610747 RepID=UPI0035CB3D8E